MSYTNRKELIKHIGKLGVFFNDENEKVLKIGTLIEVTTNGSVLDCENVYYDEFLPKTRDQVLEIISNLYMTGNVSVNLP